MYVMKFFIKFKLIIVVEIAISYFYENTTESYNYYVYLVYFILYNIYLQSYIKPSSL